MYYVNKISIMNKGKHRVVLSEFCIQIRHVQFIKVRWLMVGSTEVYSLSRHIVHSYIRVRVFQSPQTVKQVITNNVHNTPLIRHCDLQVITNNVHNTPLIRHCDLQCSQYSSDQALWFYKFYFHAIMFVNLTKRCQICKQGLYDDHIISKK